jgi:hypothetical protein
MGVLKQNVYYRPFKTKITLNPAKNVNIWIHTFCSCISELYTTAENIQQECT